MLINLDGVNPYFQARVIELVEGMPLGATFKGIEGKLKTSLVFEFDDALTYEEVIPAIKGTIHRDRIGSVIFYRAVPHGKQMWEPGKNWD